MLLVTAGIVELALRLSDPIGIVYFSEAERYFAAIQKNEAYAYIHTPGNRTVLQGVDVAINSHGLRGPEFELRKPTGTTRILILGDSVVFGWGAPQDAIFPMQLQQEFDKWPECIEVIPVGVGSWNTRTEYEYLRNVALQFEPDILVVIVVENDAEPKTGGYTEVNSEQLLGQEDPRRARKHMLQRISSPLWHAAVASSYVCKYVQYYRKRAVSAHAMAVERDSTQWQDAKLALDGIIALCRRKSIELVVCLYGTSEGVRTNPVLNLYREHLAEVGMTSYPLLPETFSSAHCHNSVVDAHPNAYGHKLIGRVLYERLEPLVHSKLRDGNGEAGNESK
jgi:hypothetical protein